MQVEASWKEAIETTLAANPSLETWKGHFRLRLHEFDELLQYWPRKRVEAALEIGCGNGLAAVYFSPLVGKIVASDLGEVDHQAHSIGLGLAKSFIREMKIGNAEVLSCSAEKIPLPDSSFDLVYGIYCLEHIPNRMAALSETRRVLRSGGEALFTVPGAAWSMLFPLPFYRELAQRIMKRITAKLKRSHPAQNGRTTAADSDAKVNSASSFLRYYPHFPFPEPHGHHDSWPAELRYYRIENWERVARAAGFREVTIEPITFLPKTLRQILPAATTKQIEKWLALRTWARPWAQFFCIRARA